MVALLKCCHVLLSDGDDDDDSNKLSVSSGYVSGIVTICDYKMVNNLFVYVPVKQLSLFLYPVDTR